MTKVEELKAALEVAIREEAEEKTAARKAELKALTTELDNIELQIANLEVRKKEIRLLLVPHRVQGHVKTGTRLTKSGKPDTRGKTRDASFDAACELALADPERNSYGDISFAATARKHNLQYSRIKSYIRIKQRLEKNDERHI